MPESKLASFELPNGLRLLVDPVPQAPAISVRLSVDVGSYDESKERTGFAHLFEHLMFQGSKNVASGEHLTLLESYGATVNATTSSDVTMYFETVPPQLLGLALWLEADRLACLDLSPENFDTQREVVAQEKLQRYDNQPYGDVLELLIDQHFSPAHPYGHLPIGDMGQLQAASLQEVKEFFNSWYRPSNIRLVLSGNVSPETALAEVNRHFGELPAAPAPRHASPPSDVPTPARVSVTRDVPHSLLYLTWAGPRGGAPGETALEIALAVLSDGNASRLHQSLVRELGVARQVQAIHLKHQRDRSVLGLAVRPSEGVELPRLVDLVHTEITKFGAFGPTPKELARAKAQALRDQLAMKSTAQGRAELISESWLLTQRPEWLLTNWETELAALVPEDIARAVTTYLTAPSFELHYHKTGQS